MAGNCFRCGRRPAEALGAAGDGLLARRGDRGAAAAPGAQAPVYRYTHVGTSRAEERRCPYARRGLPEASVPELLELLLAQSS